MIPVFAAPLSDRTGISTSFDILVDDKTFEVKSTANFDVQTVKFENGKMVLEIKSSLENNLAELQIPQNITRGQIKFYLDGNEIPAKVLQNEKISFATLEFKGNGTHTLEITSEYSKEIEQPQVVVNAEPNNVITVIAVVGIVVALGVSSTLAVYFKQKTKTT